MLSAAFYTQARFRPATGSDEMRRVKKMMSTFKAYIMLTLYIAVLTAGTYQGHTKK